MEECTFENSRGSQISEGENIGEFQGSVRDSQYSSPSLWEQAGLTREFLSSVPCEVIDYTYVDKVKVSRVLMLVFSGLL